MLLHMCRQVICADGHTYERAAITEWVRRKATSPLTNQVSHIYIFFPIIFFQTYGRAAIAEWGKVHSPLSRTLTNQVYSHTHTHTVPLTRTATRHTRTDTHTRAFP
jgi:hypothetical protein